MTKMISLKQIEPDSSELGAWNLADSVIVICAVLFSLFYCIARSAWVPLALVKTGDAANIAAFAAAWDLPENFQRDGLLGNPDNFRFYATVHIPLLRLLAPIAGGYGLAFSYLLGLHVFLQSLGFYILGRLLFRNRYWASLLVVVNLMPVGLNLGTFWGIYPDAIPRFSYQALLPFLLSAVYYWRANLKAWPWLMVFAGSLIYVHPVSAPGWAFSVWLSLWLFLPKTYPLPKKIAYMGLIGLIGAAVILPFAIHYLANYEYGEVANHDQIYEIMESRFSSGYLDLPVAVKQFFLIIHKKYLLAVSSLGLVGTLMLHRHRKDVLLVCFWIIGLIIFSICLPYLGHSIAAMRGEIPAQVDLIRGIRYLVPLMLIFCVWPLAELSQRFKSHHFKISVIGGTLVAIWIYWHPISFFPVALDCWQRGRFQCMPERVSHTVELLDTLPNVVPKSSPIFVAPSAMIASLAIRYYSLRSVVHTPKDGGALAYANHVELLTWDEVRRAMDLISQESDPEIELRMLSELSCNMDAQYLLTSKVFLDEAGKPVPRAFPASSYFERLNLQEVYSNEMFSLLKLKGCYSESN